MEGLGSLRGVSGGAVGAGGFVVGDGAAGGDRGCRRLWGSRGSDPIGGTPRKLGRTY